MLTVNEIFYSIQGESTYAGEPCIFVRLTGCNLRCSYCDTQYAFYDGKKMSIQDILKEIRVFNCNLVEITGGEPLLQNEVYPLMDILVDKYDKVLLETSGSVSIEKVNPKVIKIIDLKTPSSQMAAPQVGTHNLWSNLDYLSNHDELKFVIGNRSDYEWSKSMITQHGLTTRCKKILMAPVYSILNPKELSEWIKNDCLNVRLQIQLHKYLNLP